MWIKAVWKNCPYTVDQFSRNFCSIKLQKQAARQRVAVWTPPIMGVLKFNVDGASKGNPGPSGMGGVLRDYRNFIIGFSSKANSSADSLAKSGCNWVSNLWWCSSSTR